MGKVQVLTILTKGVKEQIVYRFSGHTKVPVQALAHLALTRNVWKQCSAERLGSSHFRHRRASPITVMEVEDPDV